MEVLVCVVQLVKFQLTVLKQASTRDLCNFSGFKKWEAKKQNKKTKTKKKTRLSAHFHTFPLPLYAFLLPFYSFPSFSSPFSLFSLPLFSPFLLFSPSPFPFPSFPSSFQNFPQTFQGWVTRPPCPSLVRNSKTTTKRKQKENKQKTKQNKKHTQEKKTFHGISNTLLSIEGFQAISTFVVLHHSQTRS